MDWELLSSLRETFLSEKSSGRCEDYWATPEHLEAYDATFAQRIGWKWDAVLRELRGREWAPAEKPALVDWGCGTGIAARRTLDAFGPDSFSSLWLFDRSSLAEDFAAAKAEGLITVERLRKSAPKDFVLLLSHVLNELSDVDATTLLTLAARAQSIIWVEPGTPALSRKLITIREELKGGFKVIAPCPHQLRCGILAPENSRHWCHHFAEPAQEAFTSSEWARFGKELGIDLRSLPVSFLVLDRREPKPAPSGRVIGRARKYKGYSTYLECSPAGVAEKKATKGKDPELFKLLKDDRFTHLLPPRD